MSSPKLFDVHTHAQFAAFDKDREAVIQRALDAGVWLINVGTQRDTSAKAVEIANKYPKGVWATVGLHPIHTEKSYHDSQELGASPASSVISDIPNQSISNSRELENSGLAGFTSKGEDFDYGYYLQLAQDPKVVAIGECGFDFYRLNPQTKGKQKKVFLRHIELAYVVKKPLMIHCRSGRTSLSGATGSSAFEYLLKILDSRKGILNSPPGIIHFFSGTKGDAQKLMDLGFSFSFGGVVTFTSDYDEVVKYIPSDRILLETDAPYVAPAPYRGKRNEPEFIIETAKRIGEIKGMEFDKISEIVKQNAVKIFRITA